MENKEIIRDLGDGLILRRSAPADAEALADFCGRIHSDDGPEQPNIHIIAWTRDLLTQPHPTFKPDDFTVVEEVATGRIVSTLNLISQTWSYAGIPFGVGRPELVGTLPEFRNRGLVRLQFEEVHRWSLARGEQVQAITGIPFYYRQFGYEMAIDLDGRRFGFEAQVPVLKAGESEQYRIRPAQEADVPFIVAVYAELRKRSLIVCERPAEIVQLDLRRDTMKDAFAQNRIIEDQAGNRIGYLKHLNYGNASALMYELQAGTSWLDVTPAVVRYLWQTGQEYAQRDGKPRNSFGFALGEQHPVYEVLKDRLPDVRGSYAWYVRVPDLPGLLQHIKPVLEQRLAESVAANISRELCISFYRSGLRLVIEHGRLTVIEPWQPGLYPNEGQVAFPHLTFLQLVFGYRSYDELHYAFPDCWCSGEEVPLLLNTLFPKRASNMYPVA